MTMAQIRTDLATRAAVDTTLETYERAPESIESPAFYVGLQRGVDYVFAYGPTGATVTFDCVIAVAPVESDEAIRLMDEYVDPQRGAKAMKVLLEDLSVSNTASMAWCEVVSSSEPGSVAFHGVEYLAVDFEVRVNV